MSVRRIVLLFALPIWVGQFSVCHLLESPAWSQQQSDSKFKPNDIEPAYARAAGPRVAVDAAHSNFHTLAGRYQPFGQVLTADGFRIAANEKPLTETSLAETDILVIANALHESNERLWKLPTPSAFEEDEIEAIVDWVAAGGSLFLIADHMPFPGAAGQLAERFDVEMTNGFAFEVDQDAQNGTGIKNGPLVFRQQDGLLGDHPIVNGFRDDERIEQVASFTGQALRGPEGSVVLLKLPESTVSLEPEQAWKFDSKTPRRDVGGWAQGLAVEFKRGRVVVWGEAAMFSAQVNAARGSRNGMSLPVARDNEQLLRNIMRWLGRFGENQRPSR